jgi:hypothetical protein
LRLLLRLRLIRRANNVPLTWIRPSFSRFWLVLRRITLILQLRFHRIALTYRIQLRLQRTALTYHKIGILLGLRRSYLPLLGRNLLSCLRRCQNGYRRDEKTGSHQGSDYARASEKTKAISSSDFQAVLVFFSGHHTARYTSLPQFDAGATTFLPLHI